MNTHATAYYLSLAIYLGICLPTTLYYSWRYYQLHQLEIVVAKRHSKIVLTICASLLLFWLIDRPLIYGTSYNDYLKWTDNITVLRTLQCIAAVAYPFISHCLTWLITFRLWCLYFDLQFNAETASSSWKEIINPIDDGRDNRYYFRNKSTFGNPDWVWRHVFGICYIMTASITATIGTVEIFGFVSLLVNIAVDFLTYMIPVIIQIIIYRKTPAIQDDFLVRYEMKLSTSITGLGGLLYIAAGAFDEVSGGSNWTISLAVNCGVIVWMAHLLLMTVWIPNQLRRKQLLQRGNRRHRPVKETQMVSIIGNSRDTTPNDMRDSSRSGQPSSSDLATIPKLVPVTSNDEILSLKECIENYDSFDAFIRHLQNELSMELLLCFTEILQYRTYVNEMSVKLTNESLDTDQSHKSEFLSITLPKGVPKSALVYSDNYSTENSITVEMDNRTDGDTTNDMQTALLQCKIRALRLYKKYISSTRAIFEVNLSFNDRMRYISVMENRNEFLRNESMDFLSLYELYERVALEMRTLMQRSYLRFCASNQFNKFVKNKAPHSAKKALTLSPFQSNSK